MNWPNKILNMNKKDYKVVNDNLRKYFNPMKRHDLNMVKLNTHNTFEHEIKKCAVAFKLLQGGATIITEGILKNGKRPDIVVLDVSPPIVYEIMVSEKEESIINKAKYYYDMRIQKVRI